MSQKLDKEPFTEGHWDEVQDFDCGQEPYDLEVSDWLKRPAGEDSALTTIKNTERPAKVWLYRLLDGQLVGFGAMGKSKWRWTGKKDPYVPVTVLLWLGIQNDYQGQPPGRREDRYAYQIMDDLIGDALEDGEAYPVFGLCVQKDNQKAVNFYKNNNFTEELDSFVDKQTGVQYLRMAMILNDEALLRQIEEAKQKK